VLAIAASNAPLLAISRLALISSRAPHPNAARLFVDYLLSQEGQRHLLKAGLFPIRSEAGDGSRTTALAPIRIDSDFDYLLDPERRRTLLSRWQAAVTGRVIP
jgi:iron(III) transport system substrate-binding protein